MKPARLISSVKAEQQLAELGGVPVDRMAYRVTRPGEQYVPDKRIACLVFDAPPPCRETRRARNEQPPINLKGVMVGRMTVIGYWGSKLDEQGRRKGGGTRDQVWVCRCPCGLYVTRTGKTIRRAKDRDDCCEYCRHLKYLKRAEQFRRLGYNEDERNATISANSA